MGADHSITTQTILGIQRSDGKILSTDNYWTIYPKGDDGLFGFENAIDILDFAATAGAYTYTVLVEDISQNTAPIAYDDTVEIPEGALVILEDIGNEERGRSYLARDGVYIQSSIFDDNGNGADIDPDGDALKLVSIDGQSVFPYFMNETAQGSRVAFSPEGEFMFLGVPGTTETFTYVVRDGRGATDEATVTFITPAGNEGPIAGDDAFDVVNTGGNIFTVFINDSDPDVASLSISRFDTTGTAGQVQLLNASQGQFFYAPQEGFNGADSFTYTVTDGQDETTATVKLNVDIEPEPGLGLLFTDEDQPFFFSEFDILEDGEAFFGSVEFDIDSAVGTIVFDEEG